MGPDFNFTIYLLEIYGSGMTQRIFDRKVFDLLQWCEKTHNWMLIDRPFPARWIVVVEDKWVCEFNETFELRYFN